MYERNAIVLEKYIEKILGLDKTYNAKKNSEDYEELVGKIEKYQEMAKKEQEMIRDFDDTAKKIGQIQKEQENLYQINQKLENDRDKLFKDLGEDAKILEKKLEKTEDLLDKNQAELKKIRQEFIQYLTDFSRKTKKQKSIGKSQKNKRSQSYRIYEKNKRRI